MEEKNIEQLLEQSVENIPVPEFSTVWENIQDKITVKKQKSNWQSKRWVPSIAVAACAVLMLSIGLPIALQQQNKTNITSTQLIEVTVTEEEFYQSLEDENIDVIDFSKYDTIDYKLYKTKNNETKGGVVEFCDNQKYATFYMEAKFYDDSITVLDNQSSDYQLNYTVNGVDIEYTTKAALDKEWLYVYDIKATYNSVTYVMEGTCESQNIKVFFETFFA